MKSKKIHNKAINIFRCTAYINPIVYVAKTGSIYITYPKGKLRVSDHFNDADETVTWTLLINKARCKKKNYYGVSEIRNLIKDIRRKNGVY